MSDLHACAAKQVVSSPWGAPLLGSPSPFAESHAKDAPRQIPSKFRTSPHMQRMHPAKFPANLELHHHQLRRHFVSPPPMAVAPMAMCYPNLVEAHWRTG